MSILTAVQDFKQKNEDVAKTLGWKGYHHITAIYDNFEVNDVWITWEIWPGRGEGMREYHAEELKTAVSEIVPEAKRIEVWGKDIPDEPDTMAVCLHEGETDDN